MSVQLTISPDLFTEIMFTTFLRDVDNITDGNIIVIINIGLLCVLASRQMVGVFNRNFRGVIGAHARL